jgi:hypothetical protein
MGKVLLLEAILGNPVALGIIVVLLVVVGIVWFVNERKEFENSERDRRNY